MEKVKKRPKKITNRNKNHKKRWDNGKKRGKNRLKRVKIEKIWKKVYNIPYLKLKYFCWE